MSIYGEWAVAMGSFGHAAMKERGRERQKHRMRLMPTFMDLPFFVPLNLNYP